MSKQKSSGLLPYPVIVAATHGDVDAINAVLKHYEGYICALSTRRLYDENGQPYMCVDEGLWHRLEAKLTAKILIFVA